MADGRKMKGRDNSRGVAQARHPSTATRREDPNVAATRIREVQHTLRVLISSTFKWVGIGFIFWIAKGMVDALAGRDTQANFKVELLSDAHFVALLAVLVAGGGGWTAYKERRLRKRNTARDHARVAQLERQIDPGRTSATLTPSGDPVRKQDHE